MPCSPPTSPSMPSASAPSWRLGRCPGHRSLLQAGRIRRRAAHQALAGQGQPAGAQAGLSPRRRRRAPRWRHHRRPRRATRWLTTAGAQRDAGPTRSSDHGTGGVRPGTRGTDPAAPSGKPDPACPRRRKLPGNAQRGPLGPALSGTTGAIGTGGLQQFVEARQPGRMCRPGRGGHQLAAGDGLIDLDLA